MNKQIFQIVYKQQRKSHNNNLSTEMSSWVGVRQSILSSVFAANLMNFAIQWIARKADDDQISNRIRHTHIYVFLFSFISLLACNLLQSGIFQAIMTWVVFGSLAFMHYTNFKAFNQKTRSMSRLIFTVLLFLQCVGTIIQYLT